MASFNHLGTLLAGFVVIAPLHSPAAGAALSSVPVPAPRPPTPKTGDATPSLSGGTPGPAGRSAPVPEKRPPAPQVGPSSSSTDQKTTTPSGNDRKEEENGKPGQSEAIPVPGEPVDKAELAACYKELDILGVTYTKEGAINDAGVCGMVAPVSVSMILPGIPLKPDAVMRCRTALQLARWTKRVVEPAAEELGSDVRLTGLQQGSAYVCKRRDSLPDTKISEHALGDAIDIVTFRFSDHKPISIAPRAHTGTIEEGFQRAVVGGACLYFTTVLGPQADSFHHDNLHLDVIERSHGFRLCE